MSGTAKYVIIGLLSGIVFVFTFITVHLPLVMAIVIGIATYVALALIIIQPTLYGVNMVGMDSDSIEILKNAIEEGNAKLNKIKALIKTIKSTGMQSKVSAVCEVADKIIKQLRRNPKNIGEARRFLNYFLDATITILTKYNEISSQDTGSVELRASLAKVEEMMDKTKIAFEKLLDRLLANEKILLDTETSLLEDTIKAEGLDK